MAINWPTLSVNMDWSSNISRSPKMEVVEFGDGAVLRFGIGINNNPGTFNINYTNMKQADFIALRDFVQSNVGTGKAIRIPNLPEDRTGNTFGYYYLTGAAITGDYSPNMSITAKECFTDD